MLIGARDFHALYKICFLDNHVDCKHNNYESIKNNLINLLVANSDEKIILIGKEIMNIFANQGSQEYPNLIHFQNCSGTVPKGKVFWGMFGKFVTSQINHNKHIQEVFVTRMKALQEDFKNFLDGNVNRAALIECLNDPNFFDNLDQRLRKESKASETEGMYFEYLPQDTQEKDFKNYVQGHLYSEAWLKTLPFGMVARIINIRDEFTARAKKGELLLDRLVLDQTSSGSVLKLVPFNPETQPVNDPYCMTFTALLYDEIKNGRTCSRVQAMEFLARVIIDHPEFQNLLLKTMAMPGVFENVVTMCQLCINQFEEAFAAEEKLKSQKPATNS